MNFGRTEVRRIAPTDCGFYPRDLFWGGHHADVCRCQLLPNAALLLFFCDLSLQLLITSLCFGGGLTLCLPAFLVNLEIVVNDLIRAGVCLLIALEISLGLLIPQTDRESELSGASCHDTRSSLEFRPA